MSDIEDQDAQDQIEKQNEEQKQAPSQAPDKIPPEDKAEEALEEMDNIENIVEESLDINIDTKQEQWNKITENAGKLLGAESLSLLEEEFNKMTPKQAEHVTNLYTKFNGELESVIDGLSDEQSQIIEDLNKKYPELLSPSIFGFSSPAEFEAVKNIEDPQVRKIIAGIKNISDIEGAKYTPIEDLAAPEIATDIEPELPGKEGEETPDSEPGQEGPQQPPTAPIESEEEPIDGETPPVGPREEDPKFPTQTGEKPGETPPVGPIQPAEQPNGPREKGPKFPENPETKPDREYSEDMQKQIQYYLRTGKAIPPEIMDTFPEATQKALKNLKLAEADITSRETLKESHLTKVKAAIEAELFLITTLLTGGAIGPEAGTGASTMRVFQAGLLNVAMNFGLPTTISELRKVTGIPDLTEIGMDAAINYLTNFNPENPVNRDQMPPTEE